MDLQSYVVDAKQVETRARLSVDENALFATYLKSLDVSKVEVLVLEIAKSVTAAIDCTSCAKCCRALVIAPDYQDVSRLAAATCTTTFDFKKKYMRRDFEGDLVFQQRPCPFLHSNRCSVYEDRPKLCRKFPYLDEGNFIGTLSRVLRNIPFCPIVFNTYERLKITLRWHPGMPAR